MKILDTRDLARRLDELQEMKTAIDEARDLLSEAESDEEKEEAQDAIDEAEADFDEAEAGELAELEALEGEISEWTHGEALIPEGDFAEYCEELCQDIGDLPRDLPSYIVIDWEATAENLRVDYSEGEYLGETYLFRA